MQVNRNIIRRNAISMFITLVLVIQYGSGLVFAKEETAATVYKNGVIYTVDGSDWDKYPQESIAISSNGRILFVGSNQDAKAYIGNNTKVIDLDGNVVFPGFLDTHTHPPGTSLTSMFNIFLPAVGTKEQVLEAISDYIESNPMRDVYWGSGFSMGIGGTEAEGKGPQKEWLDEICQDKPIILTSNDGHNMWLNSKAFEMNDITKDMEHPTGTIHKDENGELWGTLTSTYDILKMEQTFTPRQQSAALASFQDVMHSWGYTGGQLVLMSLEESGSSNIYIDYIREMERTGTWKTRASLMLRFQPESNFEEDLAFFLDTRNAIGNSDTLKVTTAKFFVDGVVEGGTAYLSEPYSNNDARGFDPDYVSVFLWDNEILKEHFSTLMSHGIQMHIHAIGDQATTETLDAFEYAHKNNPTVDARNTITHLQLVKDSDKVRMGEMGIIGSTQTFWHAKEPGFYYEVEQPFIGEKRGWAAYPVRSLMDADVVVTFSSDYPITPDPNPFWAIETAVTRNMYCGEYYGVDEIAHMDDPAWLRNPAERITVKEAIEAFTINSAYQMFMEEQIGSLAAGKWADMIIVDHDIFHVDPVDISDTTLLATIFAGEVIYELTTEFVSTGETHAIASETSEFIFEDVEESSLYFNDIMYVYGRELMAGTSTNPRLFSPNDNLTRSMIAAILYRAEKNPDVSELNNAFTDVKDGTWYFDAIKWAAENDIMTGAGDSMFAPNANITREQMAAIVYNYAGFTKSAIKRESQASLDFNDVEQISDYAVEGVTFCYMNGIMTGKPGNVFVPKEYMTRAEAATMLRMFDAFNSQRVHLD